MATIITKNSSTASSVPLNTQLVQGELAVNVTDKRLFTENASGTVVELGTNPSSLALPNGSANGVAYLNGSKVLTTGSGLQFDGTNLGLGVTPSAWATYKAFSVGNSGNSLAGTGTEIHLTANAYFNSGWKYNSTERAARFTVGENYNDFRWYQAASGTAGNAISFTQAMTLDASGNLLLNQTSSAYAASNRGLVSINGTSEAMYAFNTGGNYKGYILHDGTNFTQENQAATGSIRWVTNGTERARIDASGNFLVGRTSSGLSNGAGITLLPNGSIQAESTGPSYLNRTGSDGSVLSFRRQNVDVGNISVTASATAYNTSSDYRLKENIQPMTGALAKVAQLKPVTYKWKADGSDGEGFIAHELQAVVPQCVTGEKDAVDEDGKPVYQGIDTSFLVGTLTAAIQELHAKVQALEAQLKG